MPAVAAMPPSLEDNSGREVTVGEVAGPPVASALSSWVPLVAVVSVAVEDATSPLFSGFWRVSR